MNIAIRYLSRFNAFATSLESTSHTPPPSSTNSLRRSESHSSSAFESLSSLQPEPSNASGYPPHRLRSASSNTSISNTSSDSDISNAHRFSSSDSDSVPSSLTDDDEISDSDGDRDENPSSAFSFAPEKTQKEFRKIFSDGEVAHSEKVLKAYVCAISKEILLHGKMYVTQHFVCFYSRLFNTQKVVIPFQEIVKIEPKMMMTFIPSALTIRTRATRFTFASFSNRNRTIDVLRRIRNISPYDASYLNADFTNSEDELVLNDDGASNAPSTPHHAGWDESGQGTMLGNGQGNGQGNGPSTNGPSTTGSSPHPVARPGTRGDRTDKNPASTASKPGAGRSPLSFGNRARSISAISNRSGAATARSEDQQSTMSGGKSSSSANQSHTTSSHLTTPNGAHKWPVDNLGPAEHAPTPAPPPKEHEKQISEEKIAAPVGVVANILFGKDTEWYKHFLVDVEKNRELEKVPPFNELKVQGKREFSYIKPLNGPIGPKQTKCDCTEEIVSWDFDKCIEVLTTTSTPDVPSGSSFLTMTRLVLSWGAQNQTEIRLGTWLDWKSKSWLKGPIEKGAFDGQMAYGKALIKELGRKINRDEASDDEKLNQPPEGMKPAETVTTSAKEKSHRHSSTAKRASIAIREWQLVCVGLGCVCLVLFSLVIWLYLRPGHRAPSTEDTKRLQRIQAELDLWEWIDSRRTAHVAREKTLTDANIAAAIAATEKRLAGLKAELIN